MVATASAPSEPKLPEGFEWLPVGALIPPDSRTFCFGEWFGTAPTAVGQRQAAHSPPRARSLFPVVGIRCVSEDPKAGRFFHVLLPIDADGTQPEQFWVMAPESYRGFRESVLQIINQGRFRTEPLDVFVAALGKQVASLAAHYVRLGVLTRRP